MVDLAQTSRLDALANAMMACRPDLEPMSLDEWLAEYRDQLTASEHTCASAILRMFDDVE